MEIVSNKKRNTFINVLYQPPCDEIGPFEAFLKSVFSQTQSSNKTMHIAGDFNLNLFDHDKNRKVHNFLSLIYQNGMIPTINKPTRVTRKAATAIDHILTSLSLTEFLKQQFSKLTYLAILQFVIYHRILYQRKLKTKITSYIKEHTILSASSPLNRNYMKLSGIKQKFKIQTKPIKLF